MSIAAKLPVEPVSRDVIGSTYAAFMEEIKVRLERVGELLRTTISANTSNSWFDAEFCYLQMRRICELTALSVAIAHNQIPEFRSKDILKGWNADALFDNLLKLSPDAFPVPVTIEVDKNGPGNHHVSPLRRTMGPTELRSLYRSCSDRLHTGTLKRLLAGKRSQYDAQEILSWHNQLIRLLTTHMILLPEIRSVVVVVLKHVDDGKVHCLFADALEWQELETGSHNVQFQIEANDRP